MPQALIASRLIYDTLDRVPTCHASTVVELPNGDLAAAWYGGEKESSPDSSHYWSKLPEGADEWDTPQCLWDVPNRSAGNPRLFLDVAGRLWAILPVNYGEWCRGGTRFFYRTSDDMGETWSDPVRVYELDGLLGKNKPVVLPEGDIILPVTVEYDHTAAAALLRPGAEHWEVSSEIAREEARCIQPAFVQRSDGTLLGLLRTNEGRIWVTSSIDRGNMWAEPKPTTLQHNNSGIDLVRLANGHLVLTFNDCTKGRTPLNLAVSEDDGETWSRQMALETDEGEYSYPAIIQTRDGFIHVIYTYRRTHIKHVVLTEDAIAGS